MKPYTYSLLAAALACGMAQGAATAYTTPVGYLTTAVVANLTSNPSGAATFVAPTLIEPTEFAGSASASPSGGSIVSFAGTVPTTFDGSYMLEIVDGPQEGWWSTIVSSNASSITISDLFPAGLAADVKVQVRKFTTIKSWLGANEPGLAVFDGSSADLVNVLNPITQATTSIGYATTAAGAPQDGWYDLSGPTLADDTIVYPGTAVKIIRFAATPLSVVTSGEVKLTKTQVDIYPRDNWVGTSLATGSTYGTTGFKGQLVEFDGVVSNFDVIEKIFPDQSAIPFAAIADGVAPFIIGNLATSSDGSAEVFAEGTGVNIKRDAAGTAGIFTFPAQTVTP